MDFVTVSTGLILPYWMGLPIRYIHGGKMKNHEPNQTTIEAIEEERRMMSDSTTPKYSSIDELKAALDM